MKVYELIELLKKMPLDMPVGVAVMLDDCTAEVGRCVSVDEKDGMVFVEGL